MGARAYRVTGAAAVIRKGGHERYLDRGALVAGDGLDDDNAKHLLEVGLIEEFELPDEEPDFPEGDPSEDWKGDQLRVFAKEKGIELPKSASKAELVALIKSAAS